MAALSLSPALLLLLTSSLVLVTCHEDSVISRLAGPSEAELEQEADFIAHQKLQYWEKAVAARDFQRLSHLTSAAERPIDDADAHTRATFDRISKVLNYASRLSQDGSYLPAFLRTRLVQAVLKVWGSGFHDRVSHFKLEAARRWLDLRTNATATVVHFKEWDDAMSSCVAAQEGLGQLLPRLDMQLVIVQQEAGKLLGSDLAKIREALSQMRILFEGSKDGVTDEIEWSRFYIIRLVYLFNRVKPE